MRPTTLPDRGPTAHHPTLSRQILRRRLEGATTEEHWLLRGPRGAVVFTVLRTPRPATSLAGRDGRSGPRLTTHRPGPDGGSRPHARDCELLGNGPCWARPSPTPSPGRLLATWRRTEFDAAWMWCALQRAYSELLG